MAAIVTKATLALRNSRRKRIDGKKDLKHTVTHAIVCFKTRVHTHMVLLSGSISEPRLTESQKCIDAGGAFFHMDSYKAHTVRRWEPVGMGEDKRQDGREKEHGQSGREYHHLPPLTLLPTCWHRDVTELRPSVISLSFTETERERLFTHRRHWPKHTLLRSLTQNNSEQIQLHLFTKNLSTSIHITQHIFFFFYGNWIDLSHNNGYCNLHTWFTRMKKCFCKLSTLPLICTCVCMPVPLSETRCALELRGMTDSFTAFSCNTDPEQK